MAPYLKSTCTTLLALAFSVAAAQTTPSAAKPHKVKSHPAPQVGKHPAPSRPAPAADSTRTHKAFVENQKKIAGKLKKEQKNDAKQWRKQHPEAR